MHLQTLRAGHIVRNFRGGVMADDHAAAVEVIRFDFARNETTALTITTGRACLWTGFRGAVALVPVPREAIAVLSAALAVFSAIIWRRGR